MSQPQTIAPRPYVPAAVIERRARRKRIIAVFVGLIALIAAIVVFAWYELLREVPVQYTDDADHYKYGSIGNEAASGIPYWIWLALPRVFPQHLPGDGGYASLGMIFEQGKWDGDHWIGGEVPIGFSKKTIGFPRVAMNCALCHTTAVRGPGEVTPRVYLAGPSQQLHPQAYLRFLFACAHDERFTPDILLEEMSYDVKLSPAEQALYRYVIIPQTRQGLFELEKQYAWMANKPDWGRGRIDPFNPVKVAVLKMAPDDTIGNADMPPLWNMKEHGRNTKQDGGFYALHWDGMNSNIRDIVLSSAIGDGAMRDSIDLDGMKRVEDFLLSLPAPEVSLRDRRGQGGEGPSDLRAEVRRVSCIRRRGPARSSGSTRSAPTASGTASGPTRPPVATTRSPRAIPGSSRASTAPTGPTAGMSPSR